MEFEVIDDELNKGTARGIEQLIIELNNGGKPYPLLSESLDNLQNSTSPLRSEYYTRKLRGYLHLETEDPTWRKKYKRDQKP